MVMNIANVIKNAAPIACILVNTFLSKGFLITSSIKENTIIPPSTTGSGRRFIKNNMRLIVAVNESIVFNLYSTLTDITCDEI